jgi:hypothetical protein
MRQSQAAARAVPPAPSPLCANQNRPPRIAHRRMPRRALRWRDMRVVMAIAPTLAAITLFASYYFGVN